MLILIAIIFVAISFYKLNSGPGRNPLLWTSLALGAFILPQIIVPIIVFKIIPLFFSFDKATLDNITLASYWGSFALGLLGVFIVNHFSNKALENL